MDWIDICIIGLTEYFGTRNVYELYTCLGIEIIKLEKENTLLLGKEAIYIRNYLGTEAVYIRDDLAHPYEEFILAHELGHAILHTNLFQAAYGGGLLNKGKLERQADYFAVKLLGITVDPVDCKELTAEQIAGALCVTEECLEYVTLKTKEKR